MPNDTTAPTPQELAEAMERLEELASREFALFDQTRADLRVLLAHARAPRLTEAQREALKTAYLHVRHHGPQHDANTILAVFPELQELHNRVFGEVPRAAFAEVEQGGGE